MASLQVTDIADMLIATLPDFGELKFTDVMTNYQDTIAMKRVFKQHKMNFDSGEEIRFNLSTDHNHSARFLGLYATDIVNPTNTLTTGKVDWRHVNWNWAIDRREIAMNRTPRRVLEMAKMRRITALASAVVLFEQALWKVPATSDTTSIYGLPYYIVKSNTVTSTNDGFNGTVPSGYTLVANINPTTYPQYANYAAQYTAVTKDDLIRKLRRASWHTNFKPVVDQVQTYNTGDDYQYLSNYDTCAAIIELLEAQNESLGADIASFEGKALFLRTPITVVKELALDTTNPFYGVNWGVMKVMGLRGEWLNESVVGMQPGQHTVAATHTDCTCNLYCTDRRRNFVLATDTTMPA